mmetsp:Transcript_36885/g.56454  ORF Transcript_36885/g.56454 Transcript_36885/m.56454 type:complete len:142 (-) Transcript_36885:288-713(-)
MHLPNSSISTPISVNQERGKKAIHRIYGTENKKKLSYVPSIPKFDNDLRHSALDPPTVEVLRSKQKEVSNIRERYIEMSGAQRVLEAGRREIEGKMIDKGLDRYRRDFVHHKRRNPHVEPSYNHLDMYRQPQPIPRKVASK